MAAAAKQIGFVPTHEGRSRDVTKQVAEKILDLDRQGSSLSTIAREFVERITGEIATVVV